MRNNNRAIIRKLIRQSMRMNRKRNFFLFSAILLTTLMITSVLSIGLSFSQTMERQNLRLSGSTAQATVRGLSKDEVEQLHALPFIESIGMEYTLNHVANPWDSTPITLAVYDSALWADFLSPAMSSIVGYYPQEADEIMLSRGTLKRIGIDEPVPGMLIEIFVEDGSASMQTFRLSGYYTSHAVGLPGSAIALPVSEAYRQHHGYDNAARTVSIRFTDSRNAADNKAKLLAALDDACFADATASFPFASDNTNPLSAAPAYAVVISFLMFTGFLLIYNVLTISVANDVRFYGLLKTVGTTPKQLRTLVTGQALRLCIFSIPLGAGAAALLSLVLVPLVLSGYDTDAVIAFSPLIFAGAMLFSLLTTLLGAMFPARKASRVSPVDAAKYIAQTAKQARIHASGSAKPYRMALRNLLRDKKRAAVVFLSLFLGLTLFITVSTITSSLDAEKYAQSFGSDDFLLRNLGSRSVLPDGSISETDKLDSAFIHAIQNLPGITKLWTATRVYKQTPYTDAYDAYFADLLSRTTFSSNGILGQEQADALMKAHFEVLLLGVDTDDITALNRRLDTPLDADAFVRGEFVLLATGNPAMFDRVHEIEVTLGGTPMRLPVAGYVPEGYKCTNNNDVNVIISKSFLAQYEEAPLVYAIGLHVEEAYRQQTLTSLQHLTAHDSEIWLSSRVELSNDVHDAKVIFWVVGGSLAGILGFIGVLNFINVVSVGILSRRRELAVIESIGMTQRQALSMLVWEGVGYAAITLFFTLTAGNFIAIGVYRFIESNNWSTDILTFTYPLLPMAISALAVVLVCNIVPRRVYASIRKPTLVERLREAE